MHCTIVAHSRFNLPGIKNSARVTRAADRRLAKLRTDTVIPCPYIYIEIWREPMVYPLTDPEVSPPTR